MLFRLCFSILPLAVALALPAAEARAQAAPDGAYRVVWEVKNRFRLFREEKDFVLHAEALRGQSILEAEYDLAMQSEGRGWARNMVRRLCIDAAGEIVNPAIATACAKTISARPNTASACGSKAPGTSICTWHFARGDGSVRDIRANCNAETQVEIPYGRPTDVTVEITARRRHDRDRARLDRGARSADRRAWQLNRRRRRQSRPPGRARPTKASASASSSARPAANISGPAAPATRATALAIRSRRTGTARCLEQTRRALAERRVPSLALQLSDARRAGARRRASADRRDIPAARLHRRDHRGRPARPAARARARLRRPQDAPLNVSGAR